MVTVNKYLYQDDFGQKICSCSDKQEYKVLFREVNETELKTNEIEAVTKASIYKMEKLVVMCTECKKIYFISLSFEGSFKAQFVTLESVELFDGEVVEARNLINRIYSEYEDVLVDIATDDYVVKVLSKSEDDEKINTRYVYLNREDSILYADLQSE
ncbi:hypothetical protein [Intestinibacter sp.]|uniref:hypothetical protein n=1 Tax=Intestinibacter sp. TaxID=1965304 RepID=UPI002A90B3BB|nr:hypothetical protein [Intestinibacter sp.]MDY5212453.1 hypothetical protein [Intestinibacter sp.]